MLIGEELGLYTALAGHRLSARSPRRRPGRRALHSRVAGESGRWRLRRIRRGQRHVLLERGTGAVLADPNGPVDLPGATRLSKTCSTFASVRWRISARRRHGMGRHHRCLFYGTERFFRGGYNADSSRRGCPHSTASSRSSRSAVGRRRRLWARREHNPYGEGISESQFVGIDYHGASIETARERAGKAGAQRELRAGRRHVLSRR